MDGIHLSNVHSWLGRNAIQRNLQDSQREKGDETLKSWQFTIAEMGLPNRFPDVIPKEKHPLEYPEEVGEDYEELPIEELVVERVAT